MNDLGCIVLGMSAYWNLCPYHLMLLVAFDVYKIMAHEKGQILIALVFKCIDSLLYLKTSALVKDFQPFLFTVQKMAQFSLLFWYVYTLVKHCHMTSVLMTLLP